MEWEVPEVVDLNVDLEHNTNGACMLGSGDAGECELGSMPTPPGPGPK